MLEKSRIKSRINRKNVPKKQTLLHQPCFHSWEEKQVGCCKKFVCRSCGKMWMDKNPPFEIGLRTRTFKGNYTEDKIDSYSLIKDRIINQKLMKKIALEYKISKVEARTDRYSFFRDRNGLYLPKYHLGIEDQFPSSSVSAFKGGIKSFVSRSGVMMGGGVPTAGFTCSGDTELVCDNFDGGSTTCGDDAASQTNCWAEWSKVGAGTITNQATGLEGTYAKYLDTTYEAPNMHSIVEFTQGAPRYAFAMVKIGDITYTSATPHHFMEFVDLAVAEKCSVGMGVSTGNKFALYANSAWGSYLSSPAVVQGTTYCIWLEYLGASTANGCVFYVSEPSAGTCTKPASPSLDEDTGTATWEVDRLYFSGYDNPTDGNIDNITVDKVRIGTSAFGNQTP